MGARPVQKEEEAKAQPNVYDSPVEMDIDSPAPEPQVRNVPVEPHRAEWRAGDSNGTFVPPPTPGAQQPAKHTTPPQDSPSKRRSGQHVATEGFNVNLEDLQKTEPFYVPPQGVESTADLASAIPFASKPSYIAPDARKG
jgi:hypothetical protein